MALTFTMEIPMANGGKIQVVPDSSSGGFLLLKVIAGDGSTVESSTPMTLSQARGVLSQLSGLTQARQAEIQSGV